MGDNSLQGPSYHEIKGEISCKEYPNTCDTECRGQASNW